MSKLKIIIAILILGLAVSISYYLISNPAQTVKEETEVIRKISVKTTTIKSSTYPVKIEVMGQVTPAHSAILKAQIDGKIISVSNEFIPGGLFKKDDDIVQIDPSDYEIDVNVKKAAVSQANASLSLEIGQQQIAKDELKIIEQSTGRKLSNNDLALRKPQLEQARANLNAAKARLELSKLNLRRTKITAPFNGVITQRNSDLGNIITTRDVIATLVNTDKYWIEVEIPIYNMKWLNIPDSNSIKASKALITLNNNLGTKHGEILKSTGQVNKNSRLATMIISIPDPLSGDTPLILGDFVHVTLIGRDLENTARIPIGYIHDGNKIWIAKDGRLVVNPVVIAYSDREFAYVTKGLTNEDKVIISNITTPINGMEINIGTYK